MVFKPLRKMYSDRYTRPIRIGGHTIDDEIRTQAIVLITDDGRYEDAIALLNQEQYIDEDAHALRVRGAAKGYLKEFDAAEQDNLKAASILKKDLSVVYNNNSFIYIEKKEFDTAIEFAETAIDLNSQWAHPYVNKMCAHLSNGEISEAWGVLEDMQTRWPEGRDDEIIKWHIYNDGILSLLRSDRNFESKIKQYIN